MFKLEKFMGRRVLKSSLLENEDLTAFFTTRDLPLKAGERDDLIEEIEDNKKLLCEKLNIPQENLIIPQQTHSDNVAIVKGKWETINGKNENENEKNQFTIHHSLFTYENTDALITNQPQIALALNFADCVPIIFYDPVKKVIAAVHAGWRGTAAKIGPKTVEKMVNEFSCNPEDIIAVIGPAIGQCCFEIKEDVKQQLLESINIKVQPKTGLSINISNAFLKNHADLKLINKIQLLAYGLKKIDLCEYCTSCQNELFFSYRKEKGKTARHSAIIMVNGEK